MDEAAKRILSAFSREGCDALGLGYLLELVGGETHFARDAAGSVIHSLVNEGFLREVEGESFRRTEKGNLAVAGPKDITLYAREGCHLCEEAKMALTSMLSDFAARLREVDIDEDPELCALYTNDVPVVYIGSRLVARYRVDATRIRRYLERSTQG